MLVPLVYISSTSKTSCRSLTLPATCELLKANIRGLWQHVWWTHRPIKNSSCLKFELNKSSPDIHLLETSTYSSTTFFITFFKCLAEWEEHIFYSSNMIDGERRKSSWGLGNARCFWKPCKGPLQHIQGGRSCTTLQPEAAERSGFSMKGRIPNICRILSQNYCSDVIYELFERL